MIQERSHPLGILEVLSRPPKAIELFAIDHIKPRVALSKTLCFELFEGERHSFFFASDREQGLPITTQSVLNNAAGYPSQPHCLLRRCAGNDHPIIDSLHKRVLA